MIDKDKDLIKDDALLDPTQSEVELIQRQYMFRYREPVNDTRISSWLANQESAAKSLRFVILQVIANYGMGDVVENVLDNVDIFGDANTQQDVPTNELLQKLITQQLREHPGWTVLSEARGDDSVQQMIEAMELSGDSIHDVLSTVHSCNWTSGAESRATTLQKLYDSLSDTDRDFLKVLSSTDQDSEQSQEQATQSGGDE